MKITYPSGEGDQLLAFGKSESSRHLTVIALAVGMVFVVVASGLWLGLMQTKPASETITPSPPSEVAAQPQAPARPLYSPEDGLSQCADRTPAITTADDQTHRKLCYYAVMVIFGTTTICDSSNLNQLSKDLCAQAQVKFRQDHLGSNTSTPIPSGQLPQSTGTPITQGTSGSPSLLKPKGGSGSAGGQAASTNTSAGGNTNASQNSNVNTNTNTSPSNTNTNANTNTSNTNTNQSVNSNTNQTATTTTTVEGPPLCISDTGDITLLQHNNNCQ